MKREYRDSWISVKTEKFEYQELGSSNCHHSLEKATSGGKCHPQEIPVAAAAVAGWQKIIEHRSIIRYSIADAGSVGLFAMGRQVGWAARGRFLRVEVRRKLARSLDPFAVESQLSRDVPKIPPFLAVFFLKDQHAEKYPPYRHRRRFHDGQGRRPG
jgi:hypothetical protein